MMPPTWFLIWFITSLRSSIRLYFSFTVMSLCFAWASWIFFLMASTFAKILWIHFSTTALAFSSIGMARIFSIK